MKQKKKLTLGNLPVTASPDLIFGEMSKTTAMKGLATFGGKTFQVVEVEITSTTVASRLYRSGMIDLLAAIELDAVRRQTEEGRRVHGLRYFQKRRRG